MNKGAFGRRCPIELEAEKPRPKPATKAGTAAAPEPRRAGSNARRHGRKLAPWIIGLAFGALVISGLIPKPLPVEIKPVSRGPLTVSVLEEGKTRIRHRYVVSPPISGYLERVELRAGDPIVAGETVLARIQAEPASLLNPRLLSEAEAAVKSAEGQVKQRETSVGRARAALELAERERKRAVPLHASGAISAHDWDEFDLGAEMKQRELNTAEFALQTSRFDLQQAQAALLQAQGQGTPNGEPIAITAPVSGFVLNVLEENARAIPAGTQIMEVGDPTDLEAEIELLSTDAVRVSPGARATIERWGGDPLPAVVKVIEPAAFKKTSALGVEEQRVLVRVEFGAPRTLWARLGDRYRVEARIVTWNGDQVLQVPTGALFRRGDEWYCFRSEGGRARLHKVEVGHNNGVAAEVLSGLSPGDEVVVHPPDAVSAGARISKREE